MKQAIQNRLIFPALLLIALLGASVPTAFSATRDEVVLYLNNGQGSAVAAFDENANVCWEETFTPYGRKQVLEDSFQRTGCGTVAEERGFTGHAEDNELDLVYMQQRYYDPSSGRFLSMDPVGPIVGDPRTFNRYSYAANNPYKYTDPKGELFFLAPAVGYGIAAIGAAITVSETYTTYKEEGAGSAIKTFAIGSAASAVGGKLAHSVVKYAVQARRVDVPVDVTNGAAFSKVAPASAKQLQKKFKHAGDFGVEGNFSKANAKNFNQAIQKHLNASGTKEIQGSYRGNSVTFHTNPKTGLTVIQNPNGSFLSGWKLNPQQLNHVLKDGKL